MGRLLYHARCPSYPLRMIRCSLYPVRRSVLPQKRQAFPWDSITIVSPSLRIVTEPFVNFEPLPKLRGQQDFIR